METLQTPTRTLTDTVHDLRERIKERIVTHLKKEKHGKTRNTEIKEGHHFNLAWIEQLPGETVEDLVKALSKDSKALGISVPYYEARTLYMVLEVDYDVNLSTLRPLTQVEQPKELSDDRYVLVRRQRDIFSIEYYLRKIG